MTEQNLRRSQRQHPIKNLQESPPPETPWRATSSRKAKDPDYDYLPQQENDEPSSDVYTSPKRNIQWKEDIKNEAKQAVVEDSVHGTCCAVCGYSNQGGRTYNMAHVLDQSLAGNQETIKQLERSWGLEPGTFFLHSRSNIMILCPNCHTALDKHVFGLLPQTRIIDVVLDFTKKTVEERKKTPVSQLFEHDPDNPLKYRFVDIDWTGDDPFVVYVRDRNNKVRVKTVDPPFNHPLLSNIELHVNPVYMIWNLGLKLQGIDITTLAVPKWEKVDLLHVRRLFETWESEGEVPSPESGTATTKAVEPAKSVTAAAISERETVYSVTSEPEVAPSEPEATASVRRSKRLRSSASTGHDSINDAAPPPKRSKKGRSAGTASRR